MAVYMEQSSCDVDVYKRQGGRRPAKGGGIDAISGGLSGGDGAGVLEQRVPKRPVPAVCKKGERKGGKMCIRDRVYGEQPDCRTERTTKFAECSEDVVRSCLLYTSQQGGQTLATYDGKTAVTADIVESDPTVPAWALSLIHI